MSHEKEEIYCLFVSPSSPLPCACYTLYLFLPFNVLGFLLSVCIRSPSSHDIPKFSVFFSVYKTFLSITETLVSNGKPNTRIKMLIWIEPKSPKNIKMNLFFASYSWGYHTVKIFNISYFQLSWLLDKRLEKRFIQLVGK